MKKSISVIMAVKADGSGTGIRSSDKTGKRIKSHFGQVNFDYDEQSNVKLVFHSN